MKVRSILFALILILFIGCENETQKITVLFINDGSDFAITDLYIKDAKGNWSTSFIPEGKKLAVNHYFEFSLYLPKGEEREYYIKVSDNGVEHSLFMNDANDLLKILSWSSPIRYVNVTVKKGAGEDPPKITLSGCKDFWSPESDISNFTEIIW